MNVKLWCTVLALAQTDHAYPQNFNFLFAVGFILFCYFGVPIEVFGLL